MRSYNEKEKEKEEEKEREKYSDKEETILLIGDE